MKILLTESPGGIYIWPSSNKSPYSPPCVHVSKIKAPPEEESDDELPTGIGNNYYLSSLVIYGDLKMGGMSGGNGSMNSQTISQ